MQTSPWFVPWTTQYRFGAGVGLALVTELIVRSASGPITQLSTLNFGLNGLVARPLHVNEVALTMSSVNLHNVRDLIFWVLGMCVSLRVCCCRSWRKRIGFRISNEMIDAE